MFHLGLDRLKKFPKSHPRCARCGGAWKPGSKSNFHPNGSADFQQSTTITSHFYHCCCWNPGFFDPPSPPSGVTKSSSQLWAHPPPQPVSSTTKKEHENNRHIMKWRWYHDKRSYHIISLIVDELQKLSEIKHHMQFSGSNLATRRPCLLRRRTGHWNVLRICTTLQRCPNGSQKKIMKHSQS